MTSILYLTRNGLLEPLGQSQILAYLRGLSHDYSFTILSYEKAEDWADHERVTALQEECARLGIHWVPQRFVSQPKVLAPALSMIRMVWLVLWLIHVRKIRLVHARSYIPAAVACLVGWLTRVPFIFDMRALWPEELITAGRLRRGSFIHRAMVTAEKVCLKQAAAVVSLTEAAVIYLNQVYPTELKDQHLVVIPTCADLDRFVPTQSPPSQPVLGCLGTVLSGWFQLDWLAAFMLTVQQQAPDWHLQLTTRDDANEVRARLIRAGVHPDSFSVSSAASSQVHEVLQQQTASVMFFTEGLGKLGSSPTRMGEILGCGLPVVANAGIGDVARIIEKYQVGVLATGPDAVSMAHAFESLQKLLQDPALALRCRQAAEEVFSLASGTNAYRKIYQSILIEKCAAS